MTAERKSLNFGLESESESSESETEVDEKEVCDSGEAQQSDKNVVAKMTDDEMVTTNTKEKYFQRKWSYDDEIILLQGMTDFKKDQGKSPYDDMTGFIDTVKNCISFQANQNQFTTKNLFLFRKHIFGHIIIRTLHLIIFEINHALQQSDLTIITPLSLKKKFWYLLPPFRHQLS